MARATAGLVDQLLPVLDACDGAILHGATEVEPVYAALLQTLERQGLERIDPGGQEFDPNRHEAVMHEPGDGERHRRRRRHAHRLPVEGTRRAPGHGEGPRVR